MTVAELIAALQRLPQELPVYLADWSERYMPDIDIDSNHEMIEGASLHPKIASAERRERRGYVIERPRRVVLG